MKSFIKEKHVQVFSKVLRAIFLFLVVLVLYPIGTAISAVSSPMPQQTTVSSQTQQQPYQNADSVNIGNLPETDYVFEVPIDVSNLSTAVSALVLKCEVGYLNPDQWQNPGEKHPHVTNQKTITIDLANNSYHDPVIVGIDYNLSSTPEGYSPVYRISMSLRNRSGVIGVPTHENVSETWRIADPDTTLIKTTTWLAIPEYARISEE